MSEAEEMTGETASGEESLMEDESDGDPAIHPKTTLVVPVAEAASPAKTEVIIHAPCTCHHPLDDCFLDGPVPNMYAYVSLERCA